MIDDSTPDKLKEIIRDTWPQLFRPFRASDSNGFDPVEKPVENFIKNVEKNIGNVE